MTETATVGAVLNRAADLLDEHGWVPERSYRSTDRRRTALQAITAAVDELADRRADSADRLTDAFDAVCMHVFSQRHGTSYGSSTRSVSAWDRRPDQTAADVVATLRHVAGASDSAAGVSDSASGAEDDQ